MKVLLTHRYFWPDTTPYALMLRTIATHLVRDGHDVHVFASVPSYRSGNATAAPKHQTVDGMNIRRVWTFQEQNRLFVFRLINVFIYCAALFWRIVWLRPDVVNAATFPPVIAGWVAGISCRLVGAKLVYHMQDIHPEVSKFSGGRIGRGALFKLLRWLDNQTLRQASAILVLSDDMATTLAARDLGPLPVHVVNNFLLDDFSDAPQDIDAFKKQPGTTRIIFAGNLGKFQNLHLLSDGIAPCLAANPTLEMFFLGSGSEEAALKSRWLDHPQVTFAPFMPFAAAKVLIEDADIGVVSLASDIFRVSYPSKVLTYLGLGLPLLVLVEPQSQLAHTIEDNNLGAVPQADTPAAIAAALTDLVAASAPKSTIVGWYTQHASRDAVLGKWSAVFAQLGDDAQYSK